MKKRILIVANYFPPENNGGTERVKNFYKKLNTEEYETYVLTRKTKASKNELKAIDFDDSRVIRKKTGWYVLRLFYGILRRTGVRLSVLKGISKRLLSISIKKVNPDVCIASFPSCASFDVGLYAKELTGCKLIADYRDGLTFNNNSYDYGNANFKHELETVEKKMMDSSGFICTVIPQLTEYIVSTYSKVGTTIMNGFDDEEVIEGQSISFEEGKINVLYTGRLDCSRVGQFEYARDCLDKMFRMNMDKNFYFIGTYNDKEIGFFNSYDNVYVHDLIPRKDAVASQRGADVLLLLSSMNETGTTGKVFEYIFSRTPILNIGSGNNAERIISDTETGESFSPNNIEAINVYLNSISKNQKVGNLDNLKKYTRREECKELLKIIKNIDRLDRDNNAH